ALPRLDAGESHPEVVAQRVSGQVGRKGRRLGRALVLVRLGRLRGAFLGLAHDAVSPPAPPESFGDSRGDSPVVIRSTAIWRSISAAGRSATTRPRNSTAIRSATSHTSFMLGETNQKAV